MANDIANSNDFYVSLSHSNADRFIVDVQSPINLTNPPSGTVVYADKYITLLKDNVIFELGRPGTYLRLLPPIDPKSNSIAKVAGSAILLLCSGSILLLWNYRHAVQAWRYEIPRGFADFGEADFQTARRELIEETGMKVDSLVRVGFLETDTGLSGSQVALFLAQVAVCSDLATESSVQAGWFNLKTVWEMVRSGEITDSFTLSALAIAKSRGLID